MASLAAFSLVLNKIWAIRLLPALCVPNRDLFRLVSDYEVVYLQMIEISPMVMPFDEAEIRDLLGVMCVGKLELLYGC